ncbi:adenylate/guanylate cyclase domain-containing protein [Bacteroidota bacterium]
MPEDRRLAAIMFTDIVGYTALMGSDEDKAFQLLRKNRDLQRPLIKKYKGEWLKEMGDGILASFSTASDAVRCAGEIQNEAKKAGIPMRIGVHSGEVVFEGSDVLGDGVNVASRLEEMSDEGCITISGTVYKDIKNKAGINTKYIGDKKLKGVEDPVKVYEVLCEEEKEEATSEQPSPKSNKLLYYIIAGLVVVIIAFLIWQFMPSKETSLPTPEASADEVDRSIAVLPFTNMSNDPDQEYFSDGMMEEILMHLYKIGDLEVTSRTSAMRYKETDKLIGDIASELGVRHVLEGSVRKEGDRVRITVQLIDAVNDKHIWANSYDEELKSVFAIQSDVAQQIAKALKAEITPEVGGRITTIPTENLEAYNIYLQAHSELYQFYNVEKARELYEQAMSLDPEFAPAYAELGFYWLGRGGWGGDLEPDEVLKKALPLLRKALEIDNNLTIAHVHLSYIYLWFQWDFEGAENEWNEVFRLNPSNDDYIGSYTTFLNASGRFQEALELTEKTIKDALLSYEFTDLSIGLSYFFSGHAEKAIQFYETAMQLNPTDVMTLYYVVRIAIYTGKYEEIIDGFMKYHELPSENKRPLPPVLLGSMAIAYYHTDQKEKTENILKELIAKSDSTSVGSPAFYTAMIYAQMGETDLAFNYLEKAYETHEVEMYWLKVEPPFEPIHDDSRWQVMLDKVGFPE